MLILLCISIIRDTYYFLKGVKQVLVKLGAKGSALFTEGEKPTRQSIIPAQTVIDTTGAGDTFTAAFAVAMVEGKPKTECLRFAGMYITSIFSLLTYLDHGCLPDKVIFLCYSRSSFTLCSSEGCHSQYAY